MRAAARTLRSRQRWNVLSSPQGSPAAPIDHPHDEHAPDTVDHLRRTLKSPLTTISGLPQLLARTIRRSPSLDDGEREKRLAGFAAIDPAVQQMVTAVDGVSDWPG